MSETKIRPARRTMIRGAAWSLPVVSVAAAAPAFATSWRKDPGINGWVQVQYGTELGFDARFDSDPEGTDPATPDGAPYGLYIYDPNLGTGGTAPGTSDILTNASITLWFRGTVGSWTFEPLNAAPNAGGHGAGWSSPVAVGTQVKPDGLTYYGYRFTYSGNYALDQSQTRIYLQDFGVTAHNVNSGDATFWTERSITVNGVVQTFQRRNGERGPLGPGFPGSSFAGKSTQSAAATGSVQI